MDGARLWEAMSGFGKDPHEVAMGFDSVYVSFYKGIGGLGGAMLLGGVNFLSIRQKSGFNVRVAMRTVVRRFGSHEVRRDTGCNAQLLPPHALAL